MGWILNPEDRHVQNQIPHGAAADAGDDREPHEPHHVHALARRDERSGHGEHDGRKDVEKMDEAEQVLGIDQCGLHTMRSRNVARPSDRITPCRPPAPRYVTGVSHREIG